MRSSTSHLVSILFIISCLLPACVKKEPPSVSTSEATDITDNSAFISGTIVNDGGVGITSSGICWTADGDPTIASSKTVDMSTNNRFTSFLTDLEPGTAYCARAYAQNREGTGYGNPVYFKTWPQVPVLSDVSVLSVTTNSAVVGGHFVFTKGLEVYSTGICYSTSPNAGFSNYYNTTLNILDSISLTIKNLQQNTLYYIRLSLVVRITGTVNYYAILGPERTFRTDVIPEPPSVSTGSIKSVNSTSAEISSELLYDGGVPMISQGICFGKDPSQPFPDTVYASQCEIGQFNSRLENLKPNTKYYVRAFARNNMGTTTGNNISFITLYKIEFNSGINYGSITDFEGNVYKTVTIGTQTWMAENLRSTRFSNGVPIDNITDGTRWKNLTTPAFCWYNNDEISYKEVYGALYNWIAVNTGRICPTGYHIPSDAEWTTLTDYLGGESIAGGMMKEAGLNHWITPNQGATNNSGFTSIPGGSRSYLDGNFTNAGISGAWWSSTLYTGTKPYYRALFYNTTIFGRGSGTALQAGLSVRCIKD